MPWHCLEPQGDQSVSRAQGNCIMSFPFFFAFFFPLELEFRNKLLTVYLKIECLMEVVIFV